MRKVALVSVLSAVLTAVGSGTVMARSFGNLPLSFIANEGQVDEEVIFFERGSGHSTFFTEEGVAFCLERECAELNFLDAGTKPEVVGMDRQEGTVNYFIGSDPAKWRTGVPAYGTVMYRRIYPGIDLQFYGKDRMLEYDVVVHPGADPSLARFAYRGIRGLKETERGDLEIVLEGGSIFQKKPVIYQEINGLRKAVDGAFAVDEGIASSYSFEIASYDEKLPLIIDPVMVYSTYQGGDGTDYGNAIAVDGMGNVVIAGVTMSTDFPLTAPYQAEISGASDAFVVKVNSMGTARIFATYLGGNSGEEGLGVAVDSEGAVYVTGETTSEDFPVTEGAAQSTFGGSTDAFAAKLDGSGSSLVYSTFLGGTSDDRGYDIEVDGAGQAFLAGATLSDNFPVSEGIYQPSFGGSEDAFITTVNAAGSGWGYSTYVGGSDSEQGRGIAVGSDGTAILTGTTSSVDFPTASPFQASPGGGAEVFIFKMNSAGSAPVFSSYLGGSGRDLGADVDIDPAGNAYLTGATRSADFPLVSPVQAVIGGDYDTFVTKIDSAGSAIVYSTYLGGVDREEGVDIAVDAMGAAYVTGEVNADDFPTVRPLQGAYAGGTDGYVLKLDGSGTSLVFSTYLGGADIDYPEGIAVDVSGKVYVTGGTTSADFPTVNPIQAAIGAGYDAFISKIDLSSYSDWNGDGTEDVVWRSYSGATTGNNHLWYLGITMGSPAVTGTAALQSVADMDWAIEGAPDINGDGMPDLLWRKYGTDPDAGSNYVWYMGTTMGMHTMTGGASLPPAGTNWDVEGVPDINGDGMPDLVWRDYSTGANYVWYLGMTVGMPAVTGTAPLPAAGTMWKLDGTPDCDGDGMPDLVWRNYSTGANYVWYLGMTMGMPAVTGGAAIQAAGADWSLDGTPDANLDGKPDLLWRNYTTGANYIWYLGMTMGAPAVTGSDPLSGAAADWEIEN